MSPELGVRCDELPGLRDRAAALLLSGPVAAPALAAELFGFRRAPPELAARLVHEVLDADPRFAVDRERWLLRSTADGYGSIPLSEIDFAVVDLEATGGSPVRGDRITEVAVVRLRGGSVVDSFESLVNPERPIPGAVTALTNITNAMVADAPRFTEVSQRLIDLVEGAVFVAHNVSFDWRMLYAEFERCRGIRLGGPRVCTLRLARRLHPELDRRDLRTLADYHSISLESWHRAGPDARATAELLARFLDRLADDGIDDWRRFQEFLAGDAGDDGPSDDEDEEPYREERPDG